MPDLLILAILLAFIMVDVSDSIVQMVVERLEEAGFTDVRVFSEVECKKQGDSGDIKCEGTLYDDDYEIVDEHTYGDLAFADALAHASFDSFLDLTITPLKDEGKLVCGMAPEMGGFMGALREAAEGAELDTSVLDMPTLKCVGI